MTGLKRASSLLFYLCKMVLMSVHLQPGELVLAVLQLSLQAVHVAPGARVDVERGEPGAIQAAHH